MTKSVKIMEIGAAKFDPETGEVLTGTDAVSLRPQTAKVLEILAESAGSMVGKDDLMARVWVDTHVTDDSLVQCISEIRKALKQVGGVELKTIPRKGYRLDLPDVAEDTLPNGERSNRRLGALPVVAVLVLLVVVGGYFWAGREQAPTDQITIAVLPFRNMSGEASQSYFSDGVAEDLIVSLSNISDLRVVSRGASFAQDQSSQSLPEIAETLRAGFVLEGSVRRAGDTLRVSVALVDGGSGANVWAERFEGTSEDIFAFQDEVVAALVRTLSVRLSDAERERLGVHGTRSVEAHDAYLRGRELENLYTPQTNQEAEIALKAALQRDPNFALAHAHLAQVYSFRVENGWTDTPEVDIRAAFESAERAVAMDPELPFAHFSLGRLYTRSFAPDAEKAAQAYETAIALDPNYDDAYVFLANVHIFNGDAEQALPLIREAFDRNPVPPYWYHLAEGMAQYFLGEYEAAELALVRARDQNPTAPYPYRVLIATYAQLGNVDEADWMAMEYEALGRVATVEDLMRSASIQSAPYRDKLEAGFRKAGLPQSE